MDRRSLQELLDLIIEQGKDMSDEDFRKQASLWMSSAHAQVIT